MGIKSRYKIQWSDGTNWHDIENENCLELASALADEIASANFPARVLGADGLVKYNGKNNAPPLDFQPPKPVGAADVVEEPEP